jgi:hypothetical protein
MSAIIRSRNWRHGDSLRLELAERGWKMCQKDWDDFRVAAVSKEAIDYGVLKSTEQIDEELRDLTYGFVEISFTNPNVAYLEVNGIPRHGIKKKY